MNAGETEKPCGWKKNLLHAGMRLNKLGSICLKKNCNFCKTEIVTSKHVSPLTMLHNCHNSLIDGSSLGFICWKVVFAFISHTSWKEMICWSVIRWSSGGNQTQDLPSFFSLWNLSLPFFLWIWKQRYVLWKEDPVPNKVYNF